MCAGFSCPFSSKFCTPYVQGAVLRTRGHCEPDRNDCALDLLTVWLERAMVTVINVMSETDRLSSGAGDRWEGLS